jgi:hydrogenase expression/formation protein HypE
VAIVKKEVAHEALAFLQKDENGINARIIGEVTDTHPGKVMMKSRIGGHRVVGYLTGEQLPRIC